MTIQTAAISERGKRKNNEDHLLIEQNNGLFVVCDGVGGNEKGEVASALTCSTIGAFFQQQVVGKSNKKDIVRAISTVEAALDNYSHEHPQSAGMASTLTLVHIYQDEALLAHVGDSRIYHIRNGKILLKTFDHSLVNELLATGNISEAEVTDHPDKNKLTRAIQSAKYPTIPDISEISLLPGDLILMCTDGVLESIDDDYITRLVPGVSPEELLDAISERCRLNSADNYSAVLIVVAP